MAVVRVSHDIDGLVNDMNLIPAVMQHRGRAIVQKQIELGNTSARQIARRMAGEHGENYFKRISAEMTGPMEGEWGPEGIPKTRFTGVSGSAGAGRDLDKSLRLRGPAFYRDVGRMVDGLFWPGGGA